MFIKIAYNVDTHWREALLTLCTGYQVPDMLMNMLQKSPPAKRWFIDKLGVKDLHDGAPAVRQLYENPVTASTSLVLSTTQIHTQMLCLPLTARRSWFTS